MFNPYQTQFQAPYNNIYQPQQMNNVENNLIKVTGLDGAKAYQMAPNSAVALFDSGEDLMYIKSTDGAGFPTIRVFKFEPVENTTQLQSDYVSRDELIKFKSEVINHVEQFIQGSERATRGNGASKKRDE